jgi:hypothetical protein
MNATSAWIVAGLGVLLFSGEAYPAQGATMVVGFANPGFQTPAPYAPFVHVIPIAQFNPAWGTLSSVTYDADLYASLTGFTGFGKPNLLPPASPFNPPTGVTYTFAFEDYFAGDKEHLGTGEQTIEFVHDSPNPGHLTIHNVFSDPTYLSAFVGSGTVDFDGLSSVVTDDTHPPLDLALQINATGTITYTYTPIPEPPTVFLFALAGFVLAALKLCGRPRRLAGSF